MPRPTDNPPPPPVGHVWSDEAARRMGVTVKTLWNYRALGKGPQPKRRGRKLAYAVADIDAWLYDQDNPQPNPDRENESRPAEPRLASRTRAAA